MAIDVAASIATAKEQAHDNADWDSPYSETKARARLTALRRLNDLEPIQSGDAGAQTRFESRLAEIERIQDRLDQADGTGRRSNVTRASFEQLRMRG